MMSINYEAQTAFSSSNNVYFLVIDQLVTSQVGKLGYHRLVSNPHGVIAHFFNLNVLVPQAYILGAKEYHVQQGTVISLVCIIENWLENPWRGCKSRPFFKLSSSSIWLKRCDALLAVVAKINEGRWMDSRWVGGSGPLPMSVKELIEFVELKRKSDGWMDGWTVGLTFVTKWPKALVAEPSPRLVSQYLYWYHNNQMINLIGSGISVHTENGVHIHSRLTVPQAGPQHAGTYTCNATNTESATVQVYVSDGDKTAAIQRATGSHFVPASWTIFLVLLMILLRVEGGCR
ncbi:Striated muscle-specific serine/threonine-protein kinase [Folsomia candida]|uniref:Striated muscle-specific serine/threonine-protein kinase n=1 Tax=Folsomia candida TaxID=158441 RepID=A0A226EU21_FOLCA|nr:Striated muscle-specific serine/threonine-protein kinase [Folsomia candida]